MKDKETIELLAEEATREEQLSELEQSLAEYSAGTLSSEPLAVLKERASREPELMRALSAHRPLSSEQKREIAAVLKTHVSGDRSQIRSASERSPSQRERRFAKPLRQMRWRTWLLGVGMPLLAAAALALFVVGSPPGEVEPLGRYALEVRGTRASERAAAPLSSQTVPSVAFLSDQAPSFWLRPERRVAGAIAVFVFVSEGDTQRLLPHELERAESGALRIRLPSAGGLPREGRLWLLLARPEVASDPSTALTLARGEAETGRGWQRWKIDFVTDGSRRGEAPIAP
jgi:hypothetical protein